MPSKSDQNKRPSREERERMREINKGIKPTDKQKRTRGSKKLDDLQRRLQQEPEVYEQMLAMARRQIPPQWVDGKEIYSGKSRDFGDKFRKEWWAQKNNPTCHICHQGILANAQGNMAPSIDHVKPWSKIKLEVKTFEVCCNRMHWVVALESEVDELIKKPENLKPSHKGCNSGKGGVKGNDSIAPQPTKECTNPRDCELPKARV